MNKPDTSPEALMALADAVSSLYNVTVRTCQITSEILRAVADEKEAQGWQPIETAPMDGTRGQRIEELEATGLWHENQELRAKNERLMADAARLDYIQRTTTGGVLRWFPQDPDYPTIRDSIDAAMKGGE